MNYNEILEITEEFCSLNPLFYTAWMLGTPRFTTDTRIETACVRYDPEGNAVNYEFNQEFWNKLTTYERAFLFSHEILHVYLNHGHRSSFKQEDHDITNIAMDIVINEMLVNEFKFDRTQLPFLTDNLCFFNNVFPDLNPAHHLGKSFEYYYNLLKKKTPPTSSLTIISNSMTGNGQGGQNGKSDDKDKQNGPSSEDIQNVGDLLKEYISNTMSDESKKELAKMLNEVSNTVAGGLQAGVGAGTHFIDCSNIKVKRQMTWIGLIKKITFRAMAFKDVERWAPRNRRVQHLTSDLYLPSYFEDEDLEKYKPSLFVFLDVSGSCQSYSQKFFSAMKSIPRDKFVIRTFSFDDYVREVVGTSMYGWGGTNFSIIERKIQELMISEKIRYPDMVFVITDGYGTQVSPAKPTRWYWFLTEGSTKEYIPKECNTYKLTEYYYSGK
jgi:predicted metal-dependent peptidase